MRINGFKLFRTVAGMAMWVTVSLLLTTVGAYAQSEQSAGGNNLEGTWQIAVGLRDCNTGATLGAPFQSLISFARGGTATETTSNPQFVSPIQRSPGHGVWNANSDGTYRVSTIAFITNNGVLQVKQVITQTIAMDGVNDWHTLSATVKFYNPAGVQVAGGCAAATAKRFK